MARFKSPFLVDGKTRFRPKAELITVGTELLNGSVINSNAAYLGRELTGLGFQLIGQTSCPDEAGSIFEALKRALSRSDIIIVSGGLGPTPDDLTRQTLADYFHVALKFSPEQYREIAAYYRRKGKRVPSIVRVEASIPANAKPLFNHFGIALGFTIETEGRLIVALPGVPRELIRMYDTRLKFLLARRFPHLRPAYRLIVKAVGLSEPEVMERLGASFFDLGKFQFGIYPEVNEVSLRIYADSASLIHRLKKRIQAGLRNNIYSYEDESLEASLGHQLKKRRWTLSLAESCTGGQISEKITRIPGSSRYFLGAVTAYHNGAKSELLGVPDLLLKTKGAVSAEAALSLARGIRKRFHSTLGAAVTGIAGPGGGTPQKPVGRVYIAIDSEKGKRVWKERFAGERDQIQNRAAKKALEYLWRWVVR